MRNQDLCGCCFACSLEAERGLVTPNILGCWMWQCFTKRSRVCVNLYASAGGELFGQHTQINRAGEQHLSPLTWRLAGRGVEQPSL